MALAVRRALRRCISGALETSRKAQSQDAPATFLQHCSRGMATFSVDEMVKKIAALSATKEATVAHLMSVDDAKPYELMNKHSEYGAQQYMVRPLDRRLKRKQVFIELTKALQNKTMVGGSVLNPVRGGYAVSVGGFVAFMPRSLRKTNSLHSNFYVLNIKDNNSLVVGEADGSSSSAMTWSKLFRFYKRSLQRLNMTVWIRGTVVSKRQDGYCVAIAGHVAFLPKAFRKSRKLDSTFRIMAMYPRTGKIVVQEVNTKYFASLAASKSEHQLKQQQQQQQEQQELEQDEQQEQEQDEDDEQEEETVRQGDLDEAEEER